VSLLFRRDDVSFRRSLKIYRYRRLDRISDGIGDWIGYLMETLLI